VINPTQSLRRISSHHFLPASPSSTSRLCAPFSLACLSLGGVRVAEVAASAGGIPS